MGNKKVTDEKLSDDKDTIIAGGENFLFLDNNNFTENNVVISKLGIKNVKDDFELSLDNIDINFSDEIEIEPLVITVPSFISTPNLQDIRIMSIRLKNLLILQKKKGSLSFKIHQNWKKITAKTLNLYYSLPNGPIGGKITGETATSIFLEIIDGFLHQIVY